MIGIRLRLRLINMAIFNASDAEKSHRMPAAVEKYWVDDPGR
jgi:hypothetical protein